MLFEKNKHKIWKKKSRMGLTLVCMYIAMYKCVLLHIGVFSIPTAGLFSCSQLRGTQGARPTTTAQVWALAEVRGKCSGGSKSQVTTGRHSEHVQPSRPPRKPTYRLKECPTAHVISRILNVVNVVRHYLVMEGISPTPPCETCDHFWYNKIQSP